MAEINALSLAERLKQAAAAAAQVRLKARETAQQIAQERAAAQGTPVQAPGVPGRPGGA